MIADTMIYRECVKCGERFSGKPGETITIREVYTTVDGVCSKCGYAEKLLGALKGNGTVTLNLGAKLQLVPTFATYSGWTVSSCKPSRPCFASGAACSLRLCRFGFLCH